MSISSTYNAVGVLTLLNNAVRSAPFSSPLPPDLSNTDPFSIVNALGLPATSIFYTLINNSLNNSDYIIHNGFQIINVPSSDVLLRRLISPLYLNHLGVTDAATTVILSNVYKTIPPRLEDSFIATLNVPSDFASKWDARVKQIKDALAKKSSTSGSASFDPKNVINQPGLQTVTVLSTANPSTANAVYNQNNPNMVGNTVPRPVSIFSLGLNQMNGGSVRNLHAPLYPKLVMNGGAHPFAVISGGDSSVDNMIAVIDSRIASLKQQYQAVSGQPLDNNISNQITTYVADVRRGFEGLEKDLKDLRDASGYLAQNPLAEDLPLPANTTELSVLAEKGRAITEKSLKLSKQFGKVSKIESLLEELIKQLKPRDP
jgi:hypothetical protein